MKTISVLNQKGGCGKTSVCLGVGSGLIEKGYKVLFIDADPQSNLSETCYVDLSHDTIFEVLKEPHKITKAIIHTANGDVLPGSSKLALYNGSVTALRQALKAVRNLYDFAIIDNSPSLGSVPITSLMASNLVLIPLHADPYGIQGLDQTMLTVQEVRKRNKELKVLGLVINEYRQNARIIQTCMEIIEKKAEEYHTRLFNSRIRNCIKIQEACFCNEPNIIKYDKRSNAAIDFMALTDEIEGAIK